MEENDGNTFSQPDKGKYLPIEKTEFGFVQRSSYHQPELYHEEVIELDSPFVTSIAAGTEVFTFLVLGDQNAGKSTFLHAFTFQWDLNFLEITSFVPMISSSFLNTRFFFRRQDQEEDQQFEPMDEAPFLDSDIARASFVLTRESFEFLLQEFNTSLHKPLPEDTRFVAVQFIEIGGDHLDSLMSESASHSTLTDILSRTQKLLQHARECSKSIYFINADTLFHTTEEGTALDSASTQRLLSRLRFLNSTLSQPHQMLFYLSRASPALQLSTDCMSRSLAALQHSALTDLSTLPTLPLTALPLTEFLLRVLRHVAAQEQWALQIVDVCCTEHLNTVDGSLNASAVVNTLIRCFQNQMVHSRDPPEVFVVQELVHCYREEGQLKQHRQSQLVGTEEEELYGIFWISEGVFLEYLSDVHSTEVPPPVLLQKFAQVALRMHSYGLCLLYHSHHHSNIHVLLKHSSGTVYKWEPSPTPSAPSPSPSSPSPSSPSSPTSSLSASPEVAIRFPHYPPLFRVLEHYMTHNVPGELWLKDSTLPLHTAARSSLGEIQVQLETLLVQTWRALASSEREGQSLQDLTDTFFWLLEEWALCSTLTTGTPHAASGGTVQFSQPFHLSPALWQTLSMSLGVRECSSPSSAATTGGAVQVCIELRLHSDDS